MIGRLIYTYVAKIQFKNKQQKPQNTKEKNTNVYSTNIYQAATKC